MKRAVLVVLALVAAGCGENQPNPIDRTAMCPNATTRVLSTDGTGYCSWRCVDWDGQPQSVLIQYNEGRATETVLGECSGN